MSKYFFFWSRIQRSPEDAKFVNLVMPFGFATKTNSVFESSLKQQQQKNISAEVWD